MPVQLRPCGCHFVRTQWRTVGRGRALLVRGTEADDRAAANQRRPLAVSEAQFPSEWLSLSPKAAFRLKRYFDRFGLGDTENFDVDDDTLELLEPDIVGYQVIFEVKPDGDRIRTELVSVEDANPPAPAPAPVKAKPAAPKAEAEPEAEEAEDEDETVDADEAKPAPRPAPRQAPARQATPRRTLR